MSASIHHPGPERVGSSLANRDAAEQLDRLLREAGRGNDRSRDELLEVIYDQLYGAASHLMASRPGHTLQPTALLNEMMVRFLSLPTMARFHNSRCLFAIALDAMQKILIDHHRKKHRDKRGGTRQRHPLDAVLDSIEADCPKNYGDLHEALDRLKRKCPRQYDVVIHRYFGGLSVKETASMLGISVGSVERDWRLARAKLYEAMMAP